MAVTRTCDYCGKAAPGPVHVDVWAEGVADTNAPTGVRHTKDACDACRPKAIKEMLATGLEQLERDIPRHRTMIAARAEQAEHQKEINRLTAAVPQGSQVPRASATKIKSLEAKIAEAEQRYMEAFEGEPITTGANEGG